MIWHNILYYYIILYDIIYCGILYYLTSYMIHVIVCCSILCRPRVSLAPVHGLSSELRSNDKMHEPNTVTFARAM